MDEIWYENYQYTKQTGDRKKSNYVVVGPVSDHMQIATGLLLEMCCRLDDHDTVCTDILHGECTCLNV